jgi:signal transduction histidine kinase
VEKSVATVHRFARELRPAMLDDLGLIPALLAYMKELGKRTGLRVRFATVTADKIEPLDNLRRTVLYRIAQEALTNVAKHAQASLVKVSIEAKPGAICMTVSDNGKSFDAAKILNARRCRRLGLLGMRERAEMVGGTFAIESSPGRGTTVRVQVPLRNNNGVRE